MKVEKRNRFRIYYEILVILSDGMQSGKLNLTRIARKVNVPYDRFQKSMDQLIELGLVVSRERLVLTEEGIRYIKEYKTFEDFLGHLGFMKR